MFQNHYEIADDIIILEKDSKVLFTTSAYIQPFIVERENAIIIKDYISKLKAFSTKHDAISICGHEDLFDFLESKKIVKYNNEIVEKRCSTSMKGASIFLLLTQYCNLRCIYCLNGKETYQKTDMLKMSPQTAFNAIEKFAKTYPDCDDLEIVFFGGEPLLNYELIEIIINYCEKNIRHKIINLRYHITTNLTIFNEKLIDLIKKYNITILVDIDGDERLHNKMRPSPVFNSYLATTTNLNILNKNNIDYSLRTTVTSFNVDKMLDIARLHKELGGDSTAYVPLGPINSDLFVMPESWYPDIDKYEQGLIDILESGLWEPRSVFPVKTVMEAIESGVKLNHGCGSPFNKTSAVCVNGDAYACIYFVGNDRFKLGNVNENNYPDDKILKTMQIESHVDNLNRCKKCNYRYLCGGGCPLSKFLAEDQKYSTEKLVSYTTKRNCFSKKVFSYLIWKMAETSCNGA